MTSFVFVQSCSIFCQTGHNKWQCNLQSAFESVCSTLFQICSKKSLFTYNTEMELSEMRHDMTSLPPFKQYHIWQQQKLFSSKSGYFLWLILTLFTANDSLMWVDKTGSLGPWSRVIVYCKSVGMLPVIPYTQTTNSPIHQFTNLKCCIKARKSFKTPFNGVLFLVYYFKKYFKLCFFILQPLNS